MDSRVLDLNEAGTVIRDRWTIKEKLGFGSFGEVYSAYDSELLQDVAIKFELIDPNRRTLQLEASILRKLQRSPYCARFIHYGHFKNYNYLVMEILGQDFSKIRRSYKGNKIPLELAILASNQILSAIEDYHNIGYIHRDIKPSNFLVRGVDKDTDLIEKLLSDESRSTHRASLSTCVIVDFGLSRRYRYSDGNHRKERAKVGFRGTARYASPNSHLGRELSRRDDLVSFFYMFIEFVKGKLPWSSLRDKKEVGIEKMKYVDEAGIEKLCKGMHDEIISIGKYVFNLEYQEKPNYSAIRNALRDLYVKIMPLKNLQKYNIEPFFVGNVGDNESEQDLAYAEVTLATHRTDSMSITRNSTRSLQSHGRRAAIRSSFLFSAADTSRLPNDVNKGFRAYDADSAGTDKKRVHTGGLFGLRKLEFEFSNSEDKQNNNSDKVRGQNPDGEEDNTERADQVGGGSDDGNNKKEGGAAAAVASPSPSSSSSSSSSDKSGKSKLNGTSEERTRDAIENKSIQEVVFIERMFENTETSTSSVQEAMCRCSIY